MTQKKIIKVVGAAIIQEGKILCVQRGNNMTLSGFWEFPGGKIEAGETPEVALIREIEEELSLQIEVQDFVNEASYDYPFGKVILKTYTAHIKCGSFSLSEHKNAKWLLPAELLSLEWAPVDIPAAHILSAATL
ncbi:(deoxy)nucleoside triphosphate pyrophosphohydrolase [Aerococcaceae bacterium NML201209]|nr:(deoxy)nucleoside triphosphate pyrophosphohydrolase [Aerococcaceae bacterium NML201209]